MRPKEADKVEITPGVSVGSLRRLRAALIVATPRTAEAASSAAPRGEPEKSDSNVVDVMPLGANVIC